MIKKLKNLSLYKYLGVTIESNGSFQIDIDEIKEKAHKDYFLLISKYKGWGAFQPHICLCLFDHMVPPILYYTVF